LEESEEASSVEPNMPAAPDYVYSIPSKWTGKTTIFLVRDMWEDKVSEAELQREEISAQGMKLQSSFREEQVTMQYQSTMLEARKTLPMFTHRQQLLETIKENHVTVLYAETGAGKTSTQFGHFLLEEAFEGGFGDKISISVCSYVESRRYLSPSACLMSFAMQMLAKQWGTISVLNPSAVLGQGYSFAPQE
jgi:primosomal protein N'